MYSKSILPQELQSFDYYVNKLPLYLQNSYGFMEHFRLWYDILVGNSKTDPDSFNGILPTADMLLYLLNIFDDSTEPNIAYLNHLKRLDGTILPDDQDSEFGSKSDFLDKLAALYGLKRQFSIDYTIFVDGELQEISKQLSLSNLELLILIKMQIIKNYCEGTYEQIVKYYESIGLYMLPLNSINAATCDIYFQKIDGTIYANSINIEDMFYAGLLRIESMGINYRQTILDLTDIFIWDSSNWDEKEWAI